MNECALGKYIVKCDLLGNFYRTEKTFIFIFREQKMANFGGWDAPQVFNTSVYPGETVNDSKSAIEQAFYDFLRTFRIDHSFIYRYRFAWFFLIKFNL